MTQRQFCILLLLIFLLPPLYAQDEVVSDVRVAVLPLWYQLDDNVGPLLSTTVQNTIQWTLRFLDNYTLVETDKYPKGQTDIADYIRKNDLDNVIYGRVNSTNGSYSISLLLYETKTDQVVVIKQGSVKSSLKIFDLADDMSIALLEEFIGRRLVFGSVFLTDTGDGPGINQIYINDTLFGEDMTSIESILAGEYKMRIDQINGNDQITVFDEMVRIKEKQETGIKYRSFRYGYINEKWEGGQVPHNLTINGVESEGGKSRRRLLEEGSYTYRIRQPDSLNRIHMVFEQTIEVTADEESELAVKLKPYSPGYSFKPLKEGIFRVQIDGRDYGTDTANIDALFTGSHLVEIFQIFDTGEFPVFSRRVVCIKDRPTPVYFSMYSSEEVAGKAVNNSKNDFSLDLQTLGSSWVSAGLNYRFLNRQLSVTALVGFNYYQGAGNLTAQIKGAWVPLGDYMISPYIGPSFILNTDFNSCFGYVGVDLGALFSPDIPVLSSVYADIGLYYRLGDPRFRLGIKYTLGFLLF